MDRRAGRDPQPAQARGLGIGMVFQHFSLFETLTVAENIALALDGRVPDRRAARARIEEVSQSYGLELDPQRLVQPVGGRATARRDRALPAAEAAAPDHGRADVGADAAGGASGCS